jgi:glycosyltransferase involved in cell wall biosynthesis
MEDPARLRILFAIPELDHGGPDRVLFELLTSLDRSRFAPSLVVSEPRGYYLERIPPDVPVEILGGGTSLGDRYPMLRVLRFIRRTKPDVVFATLRMTMTLGLVSPALPRHTRLVLRQANDLSADFAVLLKQSLVKHRLARRLVIGSLRRADAVVCQSDGMKQDLRRELGAAAKLHVIWNPIDIAKTARSSQAATITLAGAPRLVAVGRLMAQKGYDLLLPAVAEVRKRHPGVHLTIYGDGPDRASLETQATALALGGAVTFAGFTKEPLPAVAAADLFVLGSRYEGFPNAALEALACGTPVVLTDCPGANRDIVRSGLNGQLAARCDPAAIAQALEAAIAELPSYDRSAIRGDCEARFASRRIVGQYEQVFSGVAAR